MTVTARLVVLVLLPLMPMRAGPSATAVVKVMVQLAPMARLAPQVVLCMLMLLLAGMAAARLYAGCDEDKVFVMLTTPFVPATKFKLEGFTLIVAPAAGPRVIFKLFAGLG
ncbi:TPA: hypothetical protein ACTXXA_001275 [Legionella anisa]